MRGLLFLLPLLAWSQASDIRFEGASATQGKISYQPSSAGDCGIAASSPLFPALNDVNGTLFAGSNSDASRKLEDPTTRRRSLVIGQRITQFVAGLGYSRALPRDSDVTVTLTCDGQAKSITFHTDTIETMNYDPLPFDSAAHGNWAMPSFDMTDRTKPVIDPLTGAIIWRVNDPSDVGFTQTKAFARQIAPGWSSPANLLSNSTSKFASISGTSKAILIPDGTESYNTLGGFNPGNWFGLHNFNVRVMGFGTHATNTNRQVNVCLSVDGGQTCRSKVITVTLPRGSNSGDATVQLANPSFSTPGFAGWGTVITREYLPVNGNASTTGTKVVTIGTPSASPTYPAHTFKYEWAKGTPFYLAGSGCNSTDICTVDHVDSPTTLTLVETPSTVTNAVWESAAFTVIVQKATDTGTISVSFGAVVAGHKSQSSPPEPTISTTSVSTSVDRNGSPLGASLTGRIGLMRDYNDNSQRAYWFSDSTPDFRLISALRVPTGIAGHAGGDIPNIFAGYSSTYGNIVPDPADPTKFYTSMSTANGTALFRLTYTCDYRALAPYKTSHTGVIDAADNCFTWENISRGRSSLTAQFTAWPTYNSKFWGASPNPALVGIVNGRAILKYLPIGQNFAGWILSVRLSDSVLENALNTININARASFGGVHAVATLDDLVRISYPPQVFGYGAAYPLSGPFTANVTHVKKSGAWTTDTSLPWPPDSSYDSACPAGLDAYYVGRGARGNNCAQIRIENEPCSASPSAAEKAAYPCPSDANKSWKGANLAPGSVFMDHAKGADSETFMVVARTGNDLTVLRDQQLGRGCQPSPDPRGRDCIGSAGQATHKSPWVLRGYPMSSEIYWDPVTNEVFDETLALACCHYDLVSRPSGKHSYVGITTHDTYFSFIDRSRSSFGSITGLSQTTFQPAFAGSGAADLATSQQSYIAAPGSIATGEFANVSTDFKHLNSQLGSAGEAPGQGFGSPRKVTLVSGTTNVYKQSGLSGTYSKSRPIWVYTAQMILKDMSSAATGNVINDADVWRFCYCRAAGECRSDSRVGDLYYVIPGANTTETKCWGSSTNNRVPCAWSAGPATAQVIQLKVGANDPDAVLQRSLGFSLTRPSMHYVYTKARAYPLGSRVLSTVFNSDGWFTSPIVIDGGRFKRSSENRLHYAPITITMDGNFVVEYGYVEYGARDAFFCTSRAEKCVARSSAVTADPVYAGESDAYKAISTTVKIPAIPGRMLYYRTLKGTTYGPLQVIPVP